MIYDFVVFHNHKIRRTVFLNPVFSLLLESSHVQFRRAIFSCEQFILYGIIAVCWDIMKLKANCSVLSNAACALSGRDGGGMASVVALCSSYWSERHVVLYPMITVGKREWYCYHCYGFETKLPGGDPVHSDLWISRVVLVLLSHRMLVFSTNLYVIEISI